MAGATQIAHHHAKAMVKRDRNTHPIARLQCLKAGNEVPVIQNIPVTERCTFRKPGCTGGILNIDRVVGSQ